MSGKPVYTILLMSLAWPRRGLGHEAVQQRECSLVAGGGGVVPVRCNGAYMFWWFDTNRCLIYAFVILMLIRRYCWLLPLNQSSSWTWDKLYPSLVIILSYVYVHSMEHQDSLNFLRHSQLIWYLNFVWLWCFLQQQMQYEMVFLGIVRIQIRYMW